MRRTLTVFALLVFAPLSPAVDFVVPPRSIQVSDGQSVIKPGEFVAPGELVDLSVAPLEKQPDHLAGVRYDWKILEGGKERKFKGNGEAVWYAAGLKPRKQQAFVVVTYLFVVRADPKDPKSAITEVATRTQFLYAEVVIGEAPPEPDPDVPVKPDGKLGLRKASRLGVAAVTVPDKKTGAAKLAAQARSVASAVAAGAYQDKGEFSGALALADWRARNREAVTPGDWTAWMNAVSPVFEKLFRDGKLADKADWALAFTEISQGLED